MNYKVIHILSVYCLFYFLELNSPDHHRPHENSDMQQIVQLADWWSSGMERTPVNMEKEKGENFGWFKYKKVRLKNLLSLVNTGTSNSTFPLNPLDISKKIFEANEVRDISSNNNSEVSKDYNKLWKDFEKQLKFLPLDSVKGFFESFLLLLQKYTWSIPASTNDLAHISLYEHLKTTAAIALALYDYKQESKCSFNDLKNGETTLPLILSCWDISGIQNFIYNVSGSKAAVSLKGRSFYLQLLMETIKQKILDHPDIQGYTGQVIYSSGGKMFILLPNTDKYKRALDEIHKDFEGIIWQQHKEQLYINQGWAEFRCISKTNGTVIYKDDNGKPTDGTIADLWVKVIDRAADNKYKKYASLFNTRLGFEPFGKWGNDYDVCAVTGEVGKIGDDLIEIGEEDGKTPVLKSVNEQIKLGQALKDVDYIITYLEKDVNGNPYLGNRILDKRNKHLVIPGTNIHHYLFDPAELTKDNAEFRNVTSVDVSRVRRINNTDFERITSLKGNKCMYGFQFYGGNQQAINPINQKNKTFEELCWTDESNKEETTHLGVLRMDIDNLGKIFKEGLAENIRSFAAYSTMSAQLDWFFSGYLNTIRSSGEFKDYVNIIYSGGDDVFAVGRWDKIILFTEKIRSEFREYIGGREDVSISGGIAIVGKKYPVRMAALQAGDAEDQSKDFELNGITKNAITFFGETISWDKEFEEVKKIKEDLVHYCNREEKPISKALLHQLMQWKSQKDNFKDDPDKASLSFKWNTAYYLKRYIDRYKNDIDAKDFIKSVQTSLMCGEAMYNKEKYGFRIYTLWGLAARWAEMEIKEFNNKIKSYEK